MSASAATDGMPMAAEVRRPVAPPVTLPFAAAALLFAALNVQMLTVRGSLAEGLAGDGPSLKVYHAVLAAFGLVLLARGRIVRWRQETLAYFVVVGATSLAAYAAFGPRASIANLAFAAYATTLGGTVGAMAGRDRTVRALRMASVAMLLLVLAKAVLYRPQILAFFASPYGHPVLPTFYGGGPNMEATWIAMAGVFLIGSRLFVPYVAGSAALSVAYASRVGLIIVAMVVLAQVARLLLRRDTGARRRWLVAAGLTALAAAGVLVAARSPWADYVTRRFESIGDDAGSTSRLALWRAGAGVFAAHPLGVGQGNAIPLIERSLGVHLTEDNLHNQYLQHLVETGVQGLAVYLLLAVMTWRRVLATRLRDPMLLYAGIYFAIAVVQFRGAEALLWFVLGLQGGVAATEMEEGDAA